MTAHRCQVEDAVLLLLENPDTYARVVPSRPPSPPYCCLYPCPYCTLTPSPAALPPTDPSSDPPEKKRKESGGDTRLRAE